MKRRYLLAVFLGAFLLFLVQPMAGKRVLPRFGGGAGVWTTCMLTFQALLLAGYAYAYGLHRWLPRRARVAVHLTLLAVSVATLWFFTRAETWQAGAGSEDPTRAILILLATAIGVPYLLLASTGPLLQSWLSAQSGTTSVYRLYALSNVASFLGLLSYPFLIEPWIPLRVQSWMWCAVYIVYAALIAACALDYRAAELAVEAAPASRKSARKSRPVSDAFLYWTSLAACGSTLLLAVTNHICQEVAIIPFLWILPLALYLATFALCFDSEHWYRREWFSLAAVVLFPLMCWSMTRILPIWWQLAIDLPALFTGCMICHGELARAKPSPERLTGFYLWMSLGGVLGGLIVAIFAPHIFSDYNEFPIALAACCLLGLEGWRRGGAFRTGPRAITWLAAAGLCGVTIASLYTATQMPPAGNRLASRNFYGILRVVDVPADGGFRRELIHGRTTHGMQIPGHEMQRWPTLYYGETSGVGLAMANHPARAEHRGLKVGAIGLGAGTMAALGKPGDTIRFYEINPDVIDISAKWFAFRLDSAAKIETVLGDARVQLEKEAPQSFDVLAVDAFNSDSIPVHLLTSECADLYRRHLKDDGILLFHISNLAVDLAPETRAIGNHLGWRAESIHSAANNRGLTETTWMVISANPRFWDNPDIQHALGGESANRSALLWTDDFSSVWRALRF